MTGTPLRAGLRRDWPLHVVVAVSLGLALFWPFERGPATHAFEFDDARSEWLVAGWSVPERAGSTTFTWSIEHHATLRLPVEGRRDRVIALHLWPNTSCAGDPQALTLRLNGHELWRGLLEGPAVRLVAAAPAAAFLPPGEENLLVLAADNACEPPNGDPRRLSIALDSIRVTDVSASR